MNNCNLLFGRVQIVPFAIQGETLAFFQHDKFQGSHPRDHILLCDDPAQGLKRNGAHTFDADMWVKTGVHLDLHIWKNCNTTHKTAACHSLRKPCPYY